MTLEDSLSVTEGMLTAYWKTDTQSYIYQHKKGFMEAKKQMR